MAVGNAKIGYLVSSTGGGGILTVYDRGATHAQIASKAYWNPAATGLTWQARRNIQAVADFISSQQEGARSDRAGVLAFAIGSDGTENEAYVAKLTPDRLTGPDRPNPEAGRVDAWVVGN